MGTLHAVVTAGAAMRPRRLRHSRRFAGPHRLRAA
jgi:hypothetical protein